MVENISQYFCYLLRHHPEGLNMDTQGWVLVTDLILHIRNKRNICINIRDVKNIVKTNSKQRFALCVKENNLYIRANQGHSLRNIDLNLKIMSPPSILYHGTGLKYINSILKQGLKKKGRNHVHLSSSKEVAYSVGIRHGEVRIFIVDTKQMVKDGCIFYLSDNNVWLTDFVDKKYLTLTDI